MKTKAWIIILTALMTVHCAKKEASSATAASVPFVQVPTGPYVPPTTGVGYSPGSDFAYGSTVEFKFDSVDLYRQYTDRYINNLSQLSNVRINLNFDKYGSSYGGTVTIRYTYMNQIFEGFFTSGHDAESTQYNIWFENGGKKVWHGFFEDFMGSVIVVIDNVVDLGDGGARKGSGSVWFKNFPVGPGFGPHPPTYCWFVSFGPYDCRAWTSGWGVNTTAGVYPGDGYQRLGTFTDIDLKKAFPE